MNRDPTGDDPLDEELRELFHVNDLVTAAVDALALEQEDAEAKVAQLLATVVDDPESYLERLEAIWLRRMHSQEYDQTSAGTDAVTNDLRAYTMLVPTIDGTEVMTRQEATETKDSFAFDAMRDYGVEESEPLRVLLDVLRPDLPLVSKLSFEDLQAYLVRQIPKEQFKRAETTLRDMFVSEFVASLGSYDDLTQVCVGCLVTDADAIRRRFETEPETCPDIVQIEMDDEWEKSIPPDYLDRFRMIRLDHATMLIGLLLLHSEGGSSSQQD